MGNYMLCKRPLAKRPFHIENIHLNIYSLEELCYFLSTNLALAEDVIGDPKLADWLLSECGFRKQIREYNALPLERGRIAERLNWIFGKSYYFNENEMRRLRIKTEAQDKWTEVEHQKKKGDALTRFGKYKHAIECYENVFKTDGIRNAGGHFRASVYHNMGYAYMQLFQGSLAMECFQKAVEQDSSWEFQKAYLKAVYFEKGSNGLNEEIWNNKLSEKKLHEIQEEIKNVKKEKLPEETGALLKKWIDTYHVNMGQ